MKKIKFLLLLLLSGHYAVAEDYKITQKSDSDKNFVFSIIKDKDNIIVARFCLVDPGPFYFFSADSDPDLFPNIEDNFSVLAARENRWQPVSAILADFNNQAAVKRSFNIKYLCDYFGLLLLAPPYISRVEVLNPNKLSRRFFMETEIEGKLYYGAIVLSVPMDASGVKKFLKKINYVTKVGMLTPVLESFPIKLVSFISGKPITIYESSKDHQGYTCIFLAGTNR